MNADGERAKEQCFLSSFADKFAKRNTNRAGSRATSGTSEREFARRIREDLERTGNVAVDQFSVASGTRAYDNFSCVLTSNPGSLINRLVTDVGMAEFFNLSPEQMSAVMPKIRIFKMIYPEGENGPEENVEFFFEGSYDPASIREMTQDRQGRGAGVGLKSFEWELIGTNTAEVDNNIKASMKLFFQNFKDLVSAEALEGFNLCDQNQDLDRVLGYNKANYLDLILRSQKFGGEEGDDGFNERYYRIKVVLGWTVDSNVVGPGRPISRDLAEKINNVGTTLLLSLLSHSIDFKEDGTIELNLEYHAAVESMLTDENTNLLYASDRTSSAAAAISHVTPLLVQAGLTPSQISRLSAFDLLAVLDDVEEDLDEEMGEEQNEDSEGADTTTEEDCPSLGDTGRETDWGLSWDWSFWSTTAEEQIEADQLSVRKARNIIMSEIYQRFLKELSQGRLYYVDVQDNIIEDENPLAAYFNVTQNFGELEIGLATGGEEAMMDYANEMQEEMVDDNNTGEGAAAALRGEGAFEGNVVPSAGQGLQAGYGMRRITYFYLGDLLNIALDILQRPGNPVELGDINMLLGTVFLQLPRFRNVGTQMDEALALAGNAGANTAAGRRLQNANPTVLVHMADLPISMNLFIQFFNERVVARSRTEWPLKTFLREVFSYLVYPSIGAGCAARNRTSRPNIDIMHISAYGDENDEDRVGAGRITDHEIDPVTVYSGRLSDRKLFHYVILQANNFNSAGRNAMEPESPEWDAEEGIFWLNIGNPRGIVKEIKFKKTDQPGLRESRMEREGTIGLGQLRDKYDCDITLFGNSLFQPGQIIYVNPTVIGLQAPGFATRLSTVLGIGGYHQVISVDNAISDTTYETILNTKWVGAGVPGCLEEEEDPCA